MSTTTACASRSPRTAMACRPTSTTSTPLASSRARPAWSTAPARASAARPTSSPSVPASPIGSERGSASFDTVSNRRWTAGRPGGLIIPDELGLRISYSGEDSDSFFYGHHFHNKEAVYVALRWEPNSQYKLDFSGEVNSQQYTENVGVNRVNQNLIDHAQYLARARRTARELFSTLIEHAPPVPDRVARATPIQSGGRRS